MTELNAAIAGRNLPVKPKILAELNTDPPETFRIDPYAGGAHITGGDLRGLMYGLLEAAEQMRADGKLKYAHGMPSLALRGVRLAAAPQAQWFTSVEFWHRCFSEMARDRFNRAEVTFESDAGDEAFEEARQITQIAGEFGVDVAIGFNAADVSAIERVLKICPLVRAIVLHQPEELANATKLLPVLSGAGRRVVLEIPDTPDAASLTEAATEQGTPVYLFAPFTGTAANPSIGNPSPRDLYWVIDPALGADAVTAISGAGFELPAPLNESHEPEIDSISDWGRLGYSRPLH
jgi:hypothetical protein